MGINTSEEKSTRGIVIMNTYKFIIVFLAATTSLAFSQSLVLTDRDIGYTRQVIIDKESASIVSNTKTNLKAGFSYSHSTINNNGMIFSAGNLITTINASVSYSDLSNVPNTAFEPQFLTNNQLLSYWGSASEYHKTLVFYDIEHDKIINTFIFSSSPPISMGKPTISLDGLTIAMKIKPYLTLFEYIDGAFIKISEIDPLASATDLFITKNGERVFYYKSGYKIG